MKIFPNQRIAILSIIQDVTKQKMVLDKTLQIYFKQHPKWGSKDRKTVAQCVYDIVRNFELIKHLSTPQQDLIDTYISLLNEEGKIDLEAVRLRYPEVDDKIIYSIPTDLEEVFRVETTESNEELIAMHRVADIYIRVNVSQIDFDVFCDILKAEAIGFEPIRTITYEGKTFELNTIKLAQKLNPNSEFYIRNQVYFEFQDLGSQLISLMVSIPDNSLILESCAGNGGKSTHILDMINQTSQLVSMDIEEQKLNHLKLRVSRLFNKKIKTEEAIPDNIDAYRNKVDYLFMDMPCTGSGTIKRQPDLKYRISKQDILKKALLQRQIFENFNPTLKSKGTLIYSTCSLFKTESQDQIEWIAATYGYQIQSATTLNPSQYAGDGFFVAVLVKD